MFEFVTQKEELLNALVTVSGAVDKKQSMPILSHFLLKLTNGLLYISATDLELEISAPVACVSKQTEGSITVPAKKFMDIMRSLDEEPPPVFVFNDKTLTIKQGRSSFKLATLSAEHYPLSEPAVNEIEINMPRLSLIQLLQTTHFAMSQQDVRIFLNGLYLECEPGWIKAVATDGHRMAIASYACAHETQASLLLPKKSVVELLKLLNSINEEEILLTAGKTHFQLSCKHYVFLSKLIDARFPPYSKVIPRNQDKQLIIDSFVLKRALSRIVILAHEKSKAVMLHLQTGQFTLTAHNNEQEEAVEVLSAETQGEELKIGLNALYLLDVLNNIENGPVRLSFSQTNSSILLEFLHNDFYQYIIMPMKI